MQAYGTTSELPRGVKRVFASCKPDMSLVNALAEGTHPVLMRVVLTNAIMLETPALDIDLQCDDATRAIAKHYPEDAGAPPTMPTNYPIHTTQRRQIKGCSVTQVAAADTEATEG